ncbi:hypothetical protein ACGFR8_28010 [Streptomyces brevispora]|uniref:hypothetical protein n=1 Tax=Streptomyces brevispora TaxID=887462 RepID=UPI0037122FFA
MLGPRAVPPFDIDVLAVYRPTGKGRVERQVRIVRDHVLAGRSFSSIEDMDGAFMSWVPRRRAVTHRTHGEVIGVRAKRDHAALRALLAKPCIVADRFLRHVAKDCLVAFDTGPTSWRPTGAGNRTLDSWSATDAKVPHPCKREPRAWPPDQREQHPLHRLRPRQDTPVPVGVTTLLPDDSVRTAAYIVMLGPEARGRGLGAQATGLTLDYAFHITNLRMVWRRVLAPTPPASTPTSEPDSSAPAP